LLVPGLPLAPAGVRLHHRWVLPDGGSAMADHGTFHWNELMTRDVESAKRFYQRTLGWSFEAMPMEGQPGDATYWIIKSGGNMVGGVFDITGPSRA
jgi:hypothetical protein